MKMKHSVSHRSVNVLQNEYALSRRVKTGVIGCGCRGRTMINANNTARTLDITHVFDPDPAAIAETKTLLEQPDSVTVCDSVDELCGSGDLEAVIITSPVHLHMDALRAAVKHGKHILLDKPVSNTVEEGMQMSELVRDYPKLCYVGLQYREKPLMQRLFDLLAQNRAGDVKMVSINEHRYPYLDKWGQWNKFEALSGGTMVEKCCHYFDLFRVIAQSEPAVIYSRGGHDVNFLDFDREGRKADVIDNSFTIIEFENGIRACLHLCMFDYQPDIAESVVVQGDRGSISTYEPQSRIHLGSNVATVNSEELHVHVGDDILATGHDGGDYYQLVRFADAVLANEPRNLPTLKDGLVSVACGAASEQSIKSGQPVRIDQLLDVHSL